MHKTSYDNMNKFVDKYLNNLTQQKLTIIDLGSQDVNGSYKPLFDNPNWNYIGLDITQGNNVDIVVKDIYNWKEFDSNSVDVLVSGQALEHIEYFWKTFKEIFRVLRHGGIFCIIAPSSGPEHHFPVDCWRFFPDGLRAVSKYAGLEVLEVYNCWNDPNFSEEENLWKDTVLIGKKPNYGNTTSA